MQWFEPLIIIAAILFVIGVFTYLFIQKRKQSKRIAIMAKAMDGCNCGSNCGCCPGCSSKNKK